MKFQITMIALASSLIAMTASAAQFDCNGTTRNDDGNWAKAKGQADWVQVLVLKPMRDNKKAKGGSLLFQGVEEDGGTAAYFDSCTRVTK